ncbi:cation:proton antiporter [Adlercreutzia sp. ZJ473]|uniref:cation:proton antiporter n=1 Tax=Adlercreutzia sp. ZJ473 TaxID=2722822 RepID=UPI0015537B5A|nr:cation:proton antiporter [Adlercreutzia sp. ZJ473]
MAAELVTLAYIALAAFACPLIAQFIPGKSIPETVLLLVAGMLLGPHVLGVVELSDAVSLLSELGLAFLFLLAGYEINPESITGRQGRRGAATWLVTLLIAFAAVALWPLFSARETDGIAVAIALTTTALGTLLPILQDRGLMSTREGGAVLSYGTWGELGPIIAMALLLSTRARWETVLILGAFAAVAVAAAVVPRRARQAGGFIMRFISLNAENNAQMLVRSVVMMLVALTALSAVFNLDIVLGSFAAGFVIRYVIPEGSEALEGKLSAIAHGFFIPLFFIVSGAKIDMTAVFANPLLLVEFIVLLLLVRTVPVFAAITTDRETRDMTPRSRLSVALYCTTALPLIVAVTSVATSSGAMSAETSSVLVAAGGVTVFIMPFLAQLLLRTADAELGGALREIASEPRRAAQILRDHRALEREKHRARRKGPHERRRREGR